MGFWGLVGLLLPIDFFRQGKLIQYKNTMSKHTLVKNENPMSEPMKVVLKFFIIKLCKPQNSVQCTETNRRDTETI